MMSGYNCTIFAYGQTGTGKTYTMSGDMTETMGMLSDNAGIIPRVLQALFAKLELEEKDHCVRCSFIELYNEELRDLLGTDESTKLKIYDDNSKKGHSTTMVQGMEERHILSATDGLKWLQEGSLKRQVAATKCNDLSSRSHTVFTITLYAKRQTGENGDDYLMAGKLNLVDLAGSENIQRSGAENKRAAEAGLINKSLLTLGRVINALVDRSPHIPYRESKLTRLLQDSLGGRTKTCIIATISPAKVNLEETISTLDYAFRAKNIRNKPQLNALINKKTLLRDFTTEIERLKGELIATRQRNGVYLSNDAYEELTVQNESRRILTEEQAAKIETLENNLRNKVQELFSLTSSFVGLKKDHEGTLGQLDDTKGVLEQTEIVLAATRKGLAEETHIRKAHQATEQRLTAVSNELLNYLGRTVNDVDGLHAKNQRKSDLHDFNRETWGIAQAHVTDITEMVESRIAQFRKGQEDHISNISGRMQDFVQEELEKLTSTQNFLDENLALFTESKQHLLERKQQSKEEMDSVLEEIKVVRDNVKQRVGESLQAIAGAAEKIAGDVLSELSTFHNQLHTSYSSLGKEFKGIFEELLGNISAQKAESDRLRQELEAATQTIVESNESVSDRIQEVLEEERKQAAIERQQLLSQITRLINSQAQLQESRLVDKASTIQDSIKDTNKTFKSNVAGYREGMNAWNAKDSQLLEEIAQSRDVLKTRLKDDWTVCYFLQVNQGLALTFSRLRTSIVHRSRRRPNLYMQRPFVLSTSSWKISTFKCKISTTLSPAPSPTMPSRASIFPKPYQILTTLLSSPLITFPDIVKRRSAELRILVSRWKSMSSDSTTPSRPSTKRLFSHCRSSERTSGPPSSKSTSRRGQLPRRSSTSTPPNFLRQPTTPLCWLICAMLQHRAEAPPSAAFCPTSASHHHQLSERPPACQLD